MLTQDRVIVGTLASGETVVDRHKSHAQSHRVPADLLAEALGRVHAGDQVFVVQQVDFDRFVGESQCVATSRQDDIIYAQRPRRDGLSRFVRFRQPVQSKSLVVILMKAQEQDEGYYVLISAYIGQRVAPEPWDERGLASSGFTMEQALHFWDRHALVWRSERFIPESVTNKYPWRALHARLNASCTADA